MSTPSPPWLESAAARLGVGVIVALSIGVGWSYWAERDEKLAWLTVGAELIAFAGLAVAVSHRWRFWGRKLGALLVTAMAAGWCGYTMYQSIDADTRAEALAAARERPAYVFAANAAQTASRLLSERLTHPSPKPECSCPETLHEWEASESAAIERLRNERDTSIAQMEAATPDPPTDWGAIGRGISVEMAKLLGFMVFGLAVSPSVALHSQTSEITRRQRSGNWLFRLAAAIPFASGASLSHAGEPAQAMDALQQDQAPIMLSASMTARATAFSMRGRFAVSEIAARVGVHQATVYRWFAARDKAMAKAAA